jgi:uncharacterized protein (AIM24 family)
MFMKSSLFEQSNLEVHSNDVLTLQNNKMLRARITPQQGVISRKGAMVAYQGNVSFSHKGSDNVGQLLKKMVSSDNAPLMTVTGDGDVFFASTASSVHIISLEGDGITVNGSNLLAFTDSLHYDISRVPGLGALSGGVWNTTLTGHGLAAISTQGQPVLLDCSQQPTFTDIQATVAWSANLVPVLKKSVSLGSFVGRGSGEAFQYAFSGAGFVVVQPSEGMPLATAG